MPADIVSGNFSGTAGTGVIGFCTEAAGFVVPATSGSGVGKSFAVLPCCCTGIVGAVERGVCCVRSRQR